MKTVIRFFIDLIKEIQKDEVSLLAEQLTYKLLLALFPFIIFLMALIGFFNLELDLSVLTTLAMVPDDIVNIFDVFIVEVVNRRNVSLLSTSLLLSVFSASSGFSAVIRGVNKAYGFNETRNFIVVRFLSVVLLFLFACTLIASLVLFIFRDHIFNFLTSFFTLGPFVKRLFGLAGTVGVLAVFLIAVMTIYKLASCKKITLFSTLPGALTTVLIWLLASKLFNLYVNNFSRFSMIYGSIASVFILMFWLNLISFVLLMGSEINALLEDYGMFDEEGEP